MRQSEHKVTIPYLDYKELLDFRDKYNVLISEIRNCFDVSLHDIDPAEPVHFRADMAIKTLGRKYLSSKYKDSVIL